MKNIDFQKCSYVFFLAKKKKNIVGIFFFGTQRKKSLFLKKDLEKKSKSAKKDLEKKTGFFAPKRLRENFYFLRKKKISRNPSYLTQKYEWNHLKKMSGVTEKMSEDSLKVSESTGKNE